MIIIILLYKIFFQIMIFKFTTKIIAVWNPFDRLYSAWKDKSRTFWFENGKINWEKAIAGTTEKMTEREKSKILKDALKQHDNEFDPKIFGIDQFEDSGYSQSYVWIFQNNILKSLFQKCTNLHRHSLILWKTGVK